VNNSYSEKYAKNEISFVGDQHYFTGEIFIAQ